ncbi:uncharacterized protein LOC124414206 [Diprion similis]|uniref:uncharacterized protein LOC124414206 n=1 Tax=Diprion similis TaxID=362088 RepID=UPI001EF97EFF|nr:uncharacterized protein LOC124414206 [Diprion similis]
MRKGSQCIARTINLSSPRNCASPRQVQKLINADVMTTCPDSRSSYVSPRPVPVRVCTRRDVERTLPPKLCECSQKLPPETLVQKLRRLANGVLKSGIAAGLVYWTTAEGVWGDAEETEILYGRIVKSVAPAFQDVVDVKDITKSRYGPTKSFQFCFQDIPQHLRNWGLVQELVNLQYVHWVYLNTTPHFTQTKAPHLENVRYKLLDGYNRAVLAIVGLMISIPMKLEEKMSEIFFACEEVSSGEKGAGNTKI